MKAWRFAWGEGHTPQAQAEFIKRTFDAFASRRDKLLSCLFYRWEDQEKCWHCGRPDCPTETAWGIVDADGNPKPGYDASATAAARLVGH